MNAITSTAHTPSKEELILKELPDAIRKAQEEVDADPLAQGNYLHMSLVDLAASPAGKRLAGLLLLRESMRTWNRTGRFYKVPPKHAGKVPAALRDYAAKGGLFLFCRGLGDFGWYEQFPSHELAYRASHGIESFFEEVPDPRLAEAEDQDDDG